MTIFNLINIPASSAAFPELEACSVAFLSFFRAWASVRIASIFSKAFDGSAEAV